MSGLYVHIPFCQSRCVYCAFCSCTKAEWQDDYVRALNKEMEMRAHELVADDDIATVYLGGGTPSVLPTPLTGNIIDGVEHHFLNGRRLCEIEESTIECNPDDVTPQLAAALQRWGFNRVSLGVQTFDEQRLRWLRRRHDALQAGEAVRRLREAGIDNISIDLMYGFPQQTTTQWQHDIEQALALRVPHLSAYCLSYEEDTHLWQQWQSGKVRPLDEEQCREQYYLLVDCLTAAGYQHYEISNFALPGHRARHNSSYWHDVPYIGLGAAAHSYNHITRRWNTGNIGRYISQTLQGNTPYEQESIDTDTHFNDLIATTLRTREGLSTARLRQVFPPQYADELLQEAQRWLKRGWLQLDNGHLHLTRQALFVSDTVMSALMRV